jgi:DNA-binding CsgD family transcriptional regulator
MFTKAPLNIHEGVEDTIEADIEALQKIRPGYREKWLKKMAFLDSISAQINAVILLQDTSVNRFLFMSDKKKILGNYDPDDFTSETGMDFSFNNIPPSQRSAALLIQLKTLSYCMEHTSWGVNNVVANMMFSYKKKSGGYFQFLQKTMVVEMDPSGHPLLYLRYGFDISHLVRPSVGLIINAPDETLIWTFNIQKKCLEQVNLLSGQEKKILALLAEGRHSKDIGDMLFVSHHTIDTHRRNLLKKTNCIDSTALITFAKMTGLI